MKPLVLIERESAATSFLASGGEKKEIILGGRGDPVIGRIANSCFVHYQCSSQRTGRYFGAKSLSVGCRSCDRAAFHPVCFDLSPCYLRLCDIQRVVN